MDEDLAFPAAVMETHGRDHTDYGFSDYAAMDAYIHEELCTDRNPAGDTPEPYCGACLSELDPDGAAIENWASAEPFLHTITDETAAPPQYRRDVDTVIEEYIAIYCPNHPERFIGAYWTETETATD